MRLTLASKIAFLFAAVSAFILIGTGFILTFSLYASSEKDAEIFLKRAAENLPNQYIIYRDNLIQFQNGPEGDSINAELRDYDISLILFDTEGNHLASFGFYRTAGNIKDRDMFLSQAQVKQIVKNNTPIYIDINNSSGDLYDTYSMPLIFDGTVRGVIQVAKQANIINDLIRNNVTMTLTILPFSIGLSAVLGFIVLKRMLRPLEVLTQIMSTMSTNYLPEIPKITKHTHDEVGKLADTFEALTTRMREGVSKQKHFIANTSHELNTPLARIASTLDVSIDEITDNNLTHAKKLIKQSRDEAMHLGEVVQSLLTMAKIQDIDEEPRKVSLKTCIQKVVNLYTKDVEAKHITVTVTCPPGTTVLAKPNHLDIIIRNIFSNAVKYNRDNGMIDVVVDKFETTCAIKVKDSGRGFKQADAVQIFDRFIRLLGAEKVADGTGLGMALVNQICESNGYMIDVSSKVYKGTTVKIGNIRIV